MLKNSKAFSFIFVSEAIAILWFGFELWVLLKSSQTQSLRSFISLVPGDKSAMNPSGIRIGLPPLTTR